MRDVSGFVVATGLVALLAGCGGGNGGGKPNDEAPQRARVEQVVGPDGGGVASSDGTLVVSLPAAALAEETAIVIEPFDGDAPHGIGNAWRLGPSGLRFETSVALTFAYGDRHPGGLGVAWREEGGAWEQGQLGPAIDAAAGTLTVPTTHFSDWAVFEAMRLVPAARSVRTGNSVSLQVEVCVRETDPETQVTALLPTCVRGGDDVQASRWSVNGIEGGDEKVGTVAGSGTGATYTAPGAVPGSNPVAVSAQVEVPGAPAATIVGSIEVTGSDCPLGICNLSCTSRSESPPTDEVGSIDEAVFTLAFSRIVDDVPPAYAEYVVTSGTATASPWLRGCSISYDPDSAEIEPDDGIFHLFHTTQRPMYTGGGMARAPSTMTTSCPDGTVKSDVDLAIHWSVATGFLEPPYESFEGTTTIAAGTISWRCTVE